MAMYCTVQQMKRSTVQYRTVQFRTGNGGQYCTVICRGHRADAKRSWLYYVNTVVLQAGQMAGELERVQRELDSARTQQQPVA